MEILRDLDQGSAEWFEARRGIPTASMFGTVMASGRGGGESKTRKTYMLKLAGEILTGEPADNYKNEQMERGHEMEQEARELYAFTTDADPDLVGFVRNGNVGASPDALIGDGGALEIKSKAPHLLIDVLLKDKFPAEHKAQCQGVLWVAEREWIDIACYWPGLPIFIKRATRDEPYIKEMAGAVDAFQNELADVVEQVRKYGGIPDPGPVPAEMMEAARLLRV